MVMEAVGAAGALAGSLGLNTPTKAKLELVGEPSPSGEVRSIEVMFNPTTYTLKQTAAVTFAASVGEPGGTANYTGTSEITLGCELMFDAFKELNGDVTGKINTILNWMRPTRPAGADSDTNAKPPLVKFNWGNSYLSNFQGFITLANVTYKLFRKDGTPIRATVTLEIKGKIEGDPPTNPTSHAIGSRRVHAMTEGDTLQSVAFHELGKPAHWRAIAEANGIDDPQRVAPGRKLLIPTVSNARRGR